MNLRILLLLVIFGLCWLQVPSAMSATDKVQTAAKPLTEVGALDASSRSISSHTLRAGNSKLDYLATAASITVYDKQSRPAGRIFYIAYTLEQQSEHPRPLTFVFNGGPGAASAYLHLGALGPQRVVFNEDGTVPPMPARIVDNPESWLVFTDLVFVDPVGTGYSREVRYDESSKKDSHQERISGHSGNTHQRSKAWGVEEDTFSLSHFIRAYLNQENRWLSPIYLAGESYGGFRVARLSKRLQSDFAIAPTGLILISPALDFSFIWGDKRSLWPWIGLLPSYAAVVTFHGLNDKIKYIPNDPRSALTQAENAALSTFLTGIASGTFEEDWLVQMSRLTGMNQDILLRWNGRIPPARFAKALLSDQRRLLSLYDGTIALVDPDPSRQTHTGPDLYLDRLNAPMTAAFNSYIRDRLNFKTDLPYLLLNKEVFESWNWRSGIHGQQGFVEAVSDLKLAMSMNTSLRTLIVHGVFDLVTPYFASEIMIKQMALDPLISDNVELKVYHGGHMPYLHQSTLERMFNDAAQFYKLAP